MNSTLLQHLNPEQLAAVTLGDEPALILAGAGSGKTRVLTTRIAWLLSQGQVGPGGVMAVTFTNKAAKEMQTRLAAMLPYNVRGMWIGTFHGLCHRFLRAHWKAAGLPQGFQILDASDTVAAVKRVIKAMNLDEERFVPKAVAHTIAHWKEEAARPKDVIPRDEQERKIVEVYAQYEAQCQREGVVDFAELMLRVYELMRDDPALRQHYQQRFRHVLVDEFQDTNKLQYAWLKLFAPPGGGAVFAVGDDDQSIYAFRGAQVGNMHAFEREYRINQLIKLEQNYRSCGHILDAANHLISHNERRLGKTLRTDQGQGEPLRVFEAPSDFDEARWVLEEAQSLHRGGLARSEIAVLYRSNAQSRVIESALFNAGIPYRVYGGLRFFERAEIKHALAYLRLLENVNDDTSFLRVVNFPARAIGARTVEQLQDAAKATGRSLWQSVSALQGRAGASLQKFVELIEGLRRATEGQTLRAIVEHVVEGSGLAAHYRSDKDGAERLENLDELITAAESFVTQEGFGKDAVALPVDELGQGPGLTPDADTGEIMSPLAAFLTHASLEAGDNQAQAGQDALQLMTIHAAKGLEFDAVFLTGLEEGLFPNERALQDFDGLEEERRLMYVAITRARKRLHLSLAQSRMLHGQTRYHVRSRFLAELPEESLKWLSPKQGGFGSGFERDYANAWQRGAGLSGVVGAGHREARAGGGGWPAPKPAAWQQAVAAPVPKKAEHDSGLRVGQAVFHNKFGEGVVLTLEGTGPDARAHIQFGRHGAKWLALSVAKLTPI
ncbi:UvrD-helicase domain-containing protein [Inhella proteolytica]|uniref:DNA 3'-5' helicase n=1 Tax=Inhella proteolytica TaxID=2795029 RepID=A0A931NIP5_9BURK|nr:UvrD-helicase domain-containing protein [Inhella proteolytica]MBH9578239.1 UvrD-helicase domain-containing protein [Inhella proteolytica]